MAKPFPTDWDVDVHYDSWESDKHWQLRKQFMEFHKNKFPEVYLVALANAYANVELNGDRYPESIMQRLEELSKEFQDQDLEKYMNIQAKKKSEKGAGNASVASQNKKAFERHVISERHFVDREMIYRNLYRKL